MNEYPKLLYHYTSIETLALILTNKNICFNTLLNVDDIQEAETSDLGLFGKFVYVSCWTDEASESISMWKMYTPDMHGVRIQLPPFPFKKHYYNKGELHFSENSESYIDLRKMYDENKGSVTADSPQLLPVTYTRDESLLCPKVRFGDPTDECCDVFDSKIKGDSSKKIRYDLSYLGKFKNDSWVFQKEWRYWISMFPFGMKEMEGADFEKHKEFLLRLEDLSTLPPYDRFFVDLSEEAIGQIEVVFGPRMTEAEKILVKHLMRGCGLDGKWRESSLRIR